jgi:hypothetical protein
MSPFFSGIWFFVIGTEPEAEINRNNNEQYPTTEEQGKRSPIISDPMFSKYFNSRNIACGSNESFIDR